MNRVCARLSFGLSVVAICLSGCTLARQKPLPKANAPLQIDAQVDVPFEEAWARSLAFANAKGMKILASDKDSGYLTFISASKKGDKKVYYNLLLKPNETGSGTLVYVFERSARGPTDDPDFLEALKTQLVR